MEKKIDTKQDGKMSLKHSKIWVEKIGQDGKAMIKWVRII